MDTLSEAQAIKIAKDAALAAGRTWREPVSASLAGGVRKKWTILSNIRSRGMNVRIVMDAETGEVLTKGCNSR